MEDIQSPTNSSGGQESVPLIEPEQRISRYDVRSVVLRRGDTNLEIDIPATGLDGAGPIVIFTFMIIWMWCLSMGCFITITVAFATSNPREYLFLLLSVPFWFKGMIMVYAVVKYLFTHSSIRINPERFEIKRTMQRRSSNRDSLNYPDIANRRIGIWEYLLCKQAKGNSSELVKAEVRKIRDRRGRINISFVLCEEMREHYIGGLVTEREMHWLRSEINEVIYNIRQPRADP